VAATGTGDAAFVTPKLAEFPTPTVATAALLPEFGSVGVVSVTDTVSLIVPEATPDPTVTTKVNTADAPDANVVPALFVHFSVARVQVHPAGPASDTAVVPAGSVSVNVIVFAVADPAVAGPRFVTVCVYVMLPPAVTGFGLPEFAKLKSASVALATAMFTIAELSEGLLSLVTEPAVAVSEIIVPAGAVALTV
jgi:hypothetical protein